MPPNEGTRKILNIITVARKDILQNIATVIRKKTGD